MTDRRKIKKKFKKRYARLLTSYKIIFEPEKGLKYNQIKIVDYYRYNKISVYYKSNKGWYKFYVEK